MSLCGICFGEITDGKPCNEENLSYDGCEEPVNIYKTGR